MLPTTRPVELSTSWAYTLRLVPRPEYVNVTDASHMVAGDRNDIFAGAVIDFLGRVVPVGAAPVQPPHELHPSTEIDTSLHDLP